MNKIPYIKVTQKEWDYIIPYLKSWGYTPVISAGQKLDDFPLLVINPDGYLGHYINLYTYCTLDYNRILITDIEEFLEKAAALKGFTYERKNSTEFTKSDLKSGMIIELRNGRKYLVVNNNKELFLLNNNSYIKLKNYTENLLASAKEYDIIKIYDNEYFECLEYILNRLNHNLIWERKEIKEVSLKEIADKFGIPVEQLRIKK